MRAAAHAAELYPAKFLQLSPCRPWAASALMRRKKLMKSARTTNRFLAVLLVLLLACCIAVVVFGTAPALDVIDASGLLSPNAPGALSGRTLSVLGDSISACADVSNNVEVNETLHINTPFFPLGDVADANCMWWSYGTKPLGMQLLTINAYSGGKVCLDVNDQPGNSGMARCVNLGTNAGQTPDVIAVFLGINDYQQKITAGSASAVDLSQFACDGTDQVHTFADGYAIMLARMRQTYPGAQIWCCTLPHYSDDALLVSYCDVIRGLAARFGCGLVDLYANSGITPETSAAYLQDGLHPNAAGMQRIGACFAAAVEQPAAQSVASVSQSDAAAASAASAASPASSVASLAA